MARPSPQLWHPEILTATGISYRQLDHWCRSGWLGPEYVNLGSGQRRQFDTVALMRLGAIVVLVEMGMRPEMAAKYAHAIGN